MLTWLDHSQLTSVVCVVKEKQTLKISFLPEWSVWWLAPLTRTEKWQIRAGRRVKLDWAWATGCDIHNYHVTLNTKHCSSPPQCAVKRAPAMFCWLSVGSLLSQYTPLYFKDNQRPSKNFKELIRDKDAFIYGHCFICRFWLRKHVLEMKISHQSPSFKTLARKYLFLK